MPGRRVYCSLHLLLHLGHWQVPGLRSVPGRRAEGAGKLRGGGKGSACEWLLCGGFSAPRRGWGRGREWPRRWRPLALARPLARGRAAAPPGLRPAPGMAALEVRRGGPGPGARTPTSPRGWRGVRGLREGSAAPPRLEGGRRRGAGDARAWLPPARPGPALGSRACSPGPGGAAAAGGEEANFVARPVPRSERRSRGGAGAARRRGLRRVVLAPARGEGAGLSHPNPAAGASGRLPGLSDLRDVFAVAYVAPSSRRGR